MQDLKEVFNKDIEIPKNSNRNSGNEKLNKSKAIEKPCQVESS
jgi:hypothetical protein